MSFDLKTLSFCFSGAPVGVNILCAAKPSTVIFGNSEVTLVFNITSDATEFAKAMQTASQLVYDLCFRAMD